MLAQGEGGGTYDDEIEPRAVELARLALELDTDRLHLLRLPCKRGCERVIAIDRLLADVDADDPLHMRDELL